MDLLAVQGTLKSLLQHHRSEASILWCSAFFIVQLSHPYMTTGKTIALTRRTFVDKVISLHLYCFSYYLNFLLRAPIIWTIRKTQKHNCLEVNERRMLCPCFVGPQGGLVLGCTLNRFPSGQGSPGHLPQDRLTPGSGPPSPWVWTGASAAWLHTRTICCL